MASSKEIGERIKTRRKELGYTMEELAEIIGYKNKSSIRRLESGEYAIRPDKIAEIATALQTTPEWIMGWKKDKLDFGSVLQKALEKSITESERNRNYQKTVVGNRIKSVRERLGISQEELASKLGHDVSFVQEMECGEKQLRMDVLATIAEFLGVSVFSLTGTSDEIALSIPSESMLFETVRIIPEEEKENVSQMVYDYLRQPGNRRKKVYDFIITFLHLTDRQQDSIVNIVNNVIEITNNK